MLNKTPTEEWQQNKINALTLRMIFAASLGTLAATLLAGIMKSQALGEIKPELLFLPWGIALVFGISIAFKAGVNAERERNAAK